MLFTPVIRRAAPHSPHAAVDPSFERFFRGGSFAAPAPIGTKGYTVAQDETTHTLTTDVPGVTLSLIHI